LQTSPGNAEFQLGMVSSFSAELELGVPRYRLLSTEKCSNYGS
jgi:hypothetical protein